MTAGIMFHHFYDEYGHKKSQGALTANDFEKSILFLKKDFNILSALEYYHKFQNNSLGANDICFTFDDNLKCQFNIALPVMEKYKITAFWFINSGPLVNIKEQTEMYRYFRTNYYDSIDIFYAEFINHVSGTIGLTQTDLSQIEKQANEYYAAYTFYSKNDKIFRFLRDWVLGRDKYRNAMEGLMQDKGINLETSDEIHNLWMAADDIRYLHTHQHIIGLHSHSHPTELKQLNEADQANEYAQNIKILENIIQQQPYTVSHPCNSYNQTTLKLLNSFGIKLGFRDNSTQATYTSLEYPRIDIADITKKI